MKTSTITVNESDAFVTTFDLPSTGSGSLDGLCFAVKDVIDVAGCKTGCGNPTWRDSHPTAVAHAVCVSSFCAPVPAAWAKQFATNWPSVF